MTLAAGRTSTQTSPTRLDRWAAFDCETTGLDIEHDRIISCALVHSSGATQQWLINPGVPVSDAAFAVHGISADHLAAHGRPPADVLTEVVGALADLVADQVPLVVMNAPFDLSLLARELHRHHLTAGPDYPDVLLPIVIDPLVLDRHTEPDRPGRRTLCHLAERYGVRVINAHDAAADAYVAGLVAGAIFTIHTDLNTRTTGELAALQHHTHTSHHRRGPAGWPTITARADTDEQDL